MFFFYSPPGAAWIPGVHTPGQRFGERRRAVTREGHAGLRQGSTHEKRTRGGRDERWRRAGKKEHFSTQTSGVTARQWHQGRAASLRDQELVEG